MECCSNRTHTQKTFPIAIVRENFSNRPSSCHILFTSIFYYFQMIKFFSFAIHLQFSMKNEVIIWWELFVFVKSSRWNSKKVYWHNPFWVNRGYSFLSHFFAALIHDFPWQLSSPHRQTFLCLNNENEIEGWKLS